MLLYLGRAEDIDYLQKCQELNWMLTDENVLDIILIPLLIPK